MACLEVFSLHYCCKQLWANKVYRKVLNACFSGNTFLCFATLRSQPAQFFSQSEVGFWINHCINCKCQFFQNRLILQTSVSGLRWVCELVLKVTHSVVELSEEMWLESFPFVNQANTNLFSRVAYYSCSWSMKHCSVPMHSICFLQKHTKWINNVFLFLRRQNFSCIPQKSMIFQLFIEKDKFRLIAALKGLGLEAFYCSVLIRSTYVHQI